MNNNPIGNSITPTFNPLPTTGGSVSNRQQPTLIPPATQAEKPTPAGEKRQTAESQRDNVDLAESMSDLNRQLQELGTSLQFSVDKKHGEMVIKVVDTETREVIRQIPAEEALAVARFFRDLEEHLGAAPQGRKAQSSALVGVLFNAKG